MTGLFGHALISRVIGHTANYLIPLPFLFMVTRYREYPVVYPYYRGEGYHRGPFELRGRIRCITPSEPQTLAGGFALLGDLALPLSSPPPSFHVHQARVSRGN